MIKRYKYYTAMQLLKSFFFGVSIIYWGVLLMEGGKVTIFDYSLNKIVAEFDWKFIFVNFSISLFSLIALTQYFWLMFEFDFYKESKEHQIFELRKRLEVYEPKEEEEVDFDD